MTSIILTRNTLALVMLSSVIICPGCGPGGPKVYPVTGKVTFNGKPINEGSITFEDPSTGVAEKADLGQGATYAVKLQAGNYKVSVEPFVVEKVLKNSPPDYAYKPAPDIPKKYHSTYESGLTYTVTEAGTYDVDMKR